MNIRMKWLGSKLREESLIHEEKLTSLSFWARELRNRSFRGRALIVAIPSLHEMGGTSSDDFKLQIRVVSQQKKYVKMSSIMPSQGWWIFMLQNTLINLKYPKLQAKQIAVI